MNARLPSSSRTVRYWAASPTLRSNISSGSRKRSPTSSRSLWARMRPEASVTARNWMSGWRAVSSRSVCSLSEPKAPIMPVRAPASMARMREAPFSLSSWDMCSLPRPTLTTARTRTTAARITLAPMTSQGETEAPNGFTPAARALVFASCPRGSPAACAAWSAPSGDTRSVPSRDVSGRGPVPGHGRVLAKRRWLFGTHVLNIVVKI